jgi:hypothetical protein
MPIKYNLTQSENELMLTVSVSESMRNALSDINNNILFFEEHFPGNKFPIKVQRGDHDGMLFQQDQLLISIGNLDGGHKLSRTISIPSMNIEEIKKHILLALDSFNRSYRIYNL